MILNDPQTNNGHWVADPTGAVYAYPAGVCPYLGGCNNTQINPAGYPCVGISSYTDEHGAGYTLCLDFGTAGEENGGDRYRFYEFSRSGASSKV